MGSTRKAFTAEYKANAVSLVLDDDRTVADVARGIGVCAQTLGNWVKKERQAHPRPEALAASERQELKQLREENTRLRMELEFAKKAAAWFARSQR